MKLVGAVYLIVVGIRRILSGDEAEEAAEAVEETRLRRLYGQGVVVNVLNPKTALFFLAFLPQFVDRDGSVPLQVAILGLLFATIALLSDLGYAVLADALAGRVRSSDRAARLRRFTPAGSSSRSGITAAAAHRSKHDAAHPAAVRRADRGRGRRDGDVVLRPPPAREALEDVSAAVTTALALPARRRAAGAAC